MEFIAYLCTLFIIYGFILNSKNMKISHIEQRRACRTSLTCWAWSVMQQK